MRWFPFLNLTLCALIVAILFITFLVVIPQSEAWTPPQPCESVKNLPKSPFELSSLEGFHKGPFALEWNEPRMQLPDLSAELLFYGLNQRPDIPEHKKLIHLALAHDEDILSFDLSKPVYLLYKGEEGYQFSPNNHPSSLWLDCTLVGSNLKVSVSMLDERGDLITHPLSNHTLDLAQHEIPRLKQVGWELDSQRVDSTLLIRQKARWVGQDLFLQEHGGEEFASIFNKERLDFGQEETYSCFVQEGSWLVFEEGRWVEKDDRETLGLPLLVIKKIEERLISCEVWDPEGKGKTTMTIVRSKDLSGMPNLDEEFKFIGAKTWAKFIVESHDERLILKPHDWLVLTEEGWIELNSEDLVDDFVQQKIRGPLLVLEKLTKQNGKQVLTGQLFNTTRTEMEFIELATTSNTSLANTFTMPHATRYSNLEDDLK